MKHTTCISIYIPLYRKSSCRDDDSSTLSHHAMHLHQNFTQVEALTMGVCDLPVLPDSHFTQLHCHLSALTIATCKGQALLVLVKHKEISCSMLLLHKLAFSALSL